MIQTRLNTEELQEEVAKYVRQPHVKLEYAKLDTSTRKRIDKLVGITNRQVLAALEEVKRHAIESKDIGLIQYTEIANRIIEIIEQLEKEPT